MINGYSVVYRAHHARLIVVFWRSHESSFTLSSANNRRKKDL
jgi:hypothetical protein